MDHAMQSSPLASTASLHSLPLSRKIFRVRTSNAGSQAISLHVFTSGYLDDQSGQHSPKHVLRHHDGGAGN